MTMTQNLKFLLLIVALFFSANTTADERIVFSGAPISKVESTVQSSDHFVLEEPQRIEYRVLVTEIDDKYYWASRENKELFLIQRGNFVFFVAPGNGYIKISIDGDGNQYLYMEHLTLALNSITYWGVSDVFQP